MNTIPTRNDPHAATRKQSFYPAAAIPARHPGLSDAPPQRTGHVIAILTRDERLYVDLNRQFEHNGQHVVVWCRDR
ncbi:conserved hypothetical protein, partial [Ricinus communis]